MKNTFAIIKNLLCNGSMDVKGSSCNSYEKVTLSNIHDLPKVNVIYVDAA